MSALGYHTVFSHIPALRRLRLGNTPSACAWVPRRPLSIPDVPVSEMERCAYASAHQAAHTPTERDSKCILGVGLCLNSEAKLLGVSFPMPTCVPCSEATSWYVQRAVGQYDIHRKLCIPDTAARLHLRGLPAINAFDALRGRHGMLGSSVDSSSVASLHHIWWYSSTYGLAWMRCGWGKFPESVCSRAYTSSIRAALNMQYIRLEAHARAD